VYLKLSGKTGGGVHPNIAIPAFANEAPAKLLEVITAVVPVIEKLPYTKIPKLCDVLTPATALTVPPVMLKFPGVAVLPKFIPKLLPEMPLVVAVPPVAFTVPPDMVKCLVFMP